MSKLFTAFVATPAPLPSDYIVGYRSGSPTRAIRLQLKSLPLGAVPDPVALVYAATIDTDASIGALFDITATGDFTLTTPTNPTSTSFDGKRLQWRIRQDATGGRIVTLDTGFRLPSSATVPLAWSTAPNALDRLVAEYNFGDDTWDVVAFIPGY
jgi:hypothetical protein